MSITGRCRCGACVYEVAVDTLPPVYACHCHLCQRWSGSAFSVQALVPEEAMTASGPVMVWEKSDAGHTSTQRVCGACHTRLYNTNTRRPGVSIVRAGTLDRSEELECRAHIYTAYRQSWVTIAADVANWEEAAPADAFAATMSR